VTADPRCTLIITASLHHAALNEQAFSLLSARRQEHQKIEIRRTEKNLKAASGAIGTHSNNESAAFQRARRQEVGRSIGGGVALVGTRVATAT
jgi:hypothetical protein